MVLNLDVSSDIGMFDEVEGVRRDDGAAVDGARDEVEERTKREAADRV